MTARSLAINAAIGVLFVLIWGVLSYVASSEAEFKSFFFGGLANFVFFLGGALATYLSNSVQAGPSNAVGSAGARAFRRGGFSAPVAVYIAAATMCAIVTLNLFAEGFTDALGRLEKLGTIAFRPEGYRDLQIYAGGIFGILCFSCATIYGLYLGSLRPETTYVTVLVGVVISLGVQGALYLLYGIFFDSQALQVFHVSTPPVLDTYDPLFRKVVSFAITAAGIAMATVGWTTVFWLSVKLGRLSRRFRSP